MGLGVGDQFPQVTGLQIVKGKEVPIGKPSNNVLVVEFWATWCPPCRTSIPHLTELQHKYGPKGLVIIGITSEPSASIQGFLTQMGNQMDYVVAVDAANSARRKVMEPGGVSGIPHSFVVDRSNRIVFSGHPMDGGFEAAIRKAVADAGPPPTPVAQKTTVAPPIKATREELMAMSTSELKKILTERQQSVFGLIEKADLVDAILRKCT